jgi:hypothetical protein
MTFISQTSLSRGTPDVIATFDCASTVYVGSWVYMDSSAIIRNAIATSAITSNVIGVTEEKLSATSCRVRLLGITVGIFLGLTPNTPQFLSVVTAGAMSTVIPTGAGEYILRLGTPLSATQMLISPQIRLKRAL